MEITIYSKDNCPNCVKALNLLKKYKPNVLKLGKDLSRDDFFSKFPNIKTVPQIIINSKHIGGYTDLEKWLSFETQEDF